MLLEQARRTDCIRFFGVGNEITLVRASSNVADSTVDNASPMKSSVSLVSGTVRELWTAASLVTYNAQGSRTGLWRSLSMQCVEGYTR
ncbi:hypothetical protein Y032_0151g2839 [Ancylostoma ceylanicum]|uniref:Uncharacterized protein n=1 Tax=Ancylostoma ceylanicum TaxID=53326 RepID=A0A016T169_9BILA|nr:hypothetical protein Y032_0151g2839 [Ancylostoma ceylanicum]